MVADRFDSLVSSRRAQLEIPGSNAGLAHLKSSPVLVQEYYQRKYVDKFLKFP